MAAKKSRARRPPAKKTSPKNAIPSVFEELVARVNAIDWVKVSAGSEGASFPKDLERYLGARTRDQRSRALDALWRGQVDRPIGGLSSRFLVELLAYPGSIDVCGLLRLLVAMITSDHTRWFDGPFDVDRIGMTLSRLNKWRAIAGRRELAVLLLEHDDEAVRAHAAFLLAWLGSAHSSEIVPLLRGKTGDPSPLVRASALLAIGMHGLEGPYLEHLGDQDGRVGLAAALAATFAPSQDLTGPALDRIGESLHSGGQAPWPELPWARGELSRIALSRALALGERYEARTRTWLSAQLDGERAAEVVCRLLERAFPGKKPAEPLTAEQREALELVISRPKTHPAAVGFLASCGLPLGGSRLVHKQIDALRKYLGLPRPAPDKGPLGIVSHMGISKPVQHWWSDYAEAGEPEPGALARAIALQTPPAELVELLLLSSDLEPDVHGPSLDCPFVYPDVEGGTRRGDGALVFPGEGWPARARAYMGVLRGQGWYVESEWWYGSSVSVIAHKEGKVLSFSFGNDWNRGKPILTEAEFVPTRRFSIARLVAEEALQLTPDWQDALLQRISANPPRQDGLMWAHRLTGAAIWAYGASGREPPVGVDDAAVQMQGFWSYVQGPFLVYSRMLGPERREELVLRVMRESYEASRQGVPELYGVAPTPRVLEQIAPYARRHLDNWHDRRGELVARWERVLGPLAGPLLEAARQQKSAC